MRVSTALVVTALVTIPFTVRPSAQGPAAGRIVGGELLVKFKPGVGPNLKADTHRAAGGRVLAEIARTGVQRIAIAVGDEAAAIARYQRNPNVLYAEPNHIRHLPKLVSHAPGTELMPGDHYFDEQWALHNAGQLFYCIPWIFEEELCLYVGTADADIDAPEAWAVSAGSAVIVATIDSGIDYNHPDLAPNYIGGYDFANGDSDPFDDHGHGTHVAGIIAAALNNPTGSPAADEGVVGVAPNAKLLAYKVCLASGECSDFAINQAIAQAVTDGARVINMSLGDPAYSASLNDAVQDAWNAGVVIVAAAGNDGTTTPLYPAALDHVVSVAAFDEDGRQPSFTNYGSSVDISAPGNVIMSTYPMAACIDSGIPGDLGCYEWLTGTSMASPHVAGAAALLLGRGDTLTNSQVVDILLETADGQGVAPGRLDSWTAHGGLNLHNAMSVGAAPNVAPTANAGADQTVTDAGGNGVESVTLDGSASSDADGTIVSYEWREGAAVVGAGVSPVVSLSVGTHVLTLQVTDDDGATATDGVTVTVNAAPNAPPTANAGADQTVTDAGGNGVESVTLNGSGSSDADGAIVSYEWREGAAVVGAGVSPVVSLSVGTHVLTLQVTDDDGATATDSVTVTVNALSVPTTSHVGDLDGSGAASKNTWSALVTVAVHNTGHQPVVGAVVTGRWSGDATGTATCTTGADGRCLIASGSVHKRTSTTTLSVIGIAASGLTYTAAQNHDPEADSNGTVITVRKP